MKLLTAVIIIGIVIWYLDFMSPEKRKKSLILPFLRQLTYKVKLDFFSGQLAGKEI